MELKKTIRMFFHDMAIQELKIQNAEQVGTKLTYNSMLYLDVISARPGVYTASKIADMLQKARPSVTQKLNYLEEQGYIEKKQSDTDKRTYYLYTTQKAIPLEAELVRMEEDTEKRFLEKYSNSEIERFLEMFAELSNMYSVVGKGHKE